MKSFNDIIIKLSINPHMIYFNSLDIKSELTSYKNKKGIYLWYNNKNGKFYIGSSVNLYNRLRVYFNPKTLNKENMLIYKAILKYGYENFTLMIIELVDLNDSVLEKEQYYFNLLNPTYNILKYSSNSLGFRHSLETIEKMKGNLNSKNQIMSESAKLAISNYQKNRYKILTEEEFNLLKSKLKRKNPVIVSENIKLKIQNTLLNKSSYYVYNLEGKLIYKFNNKLEIGKYFNINGNTIRDYYYDKNKIFRNIYYIRSK